MAKIYDAKRTRTETAKDDARLKDLHIKWMVMRNIGDEEDDWRRPTMLLIKKIGRLGLNDLPFRDRLTRRRDQMATRAKIFLLATCAAS
jgi:hypothetical protein